MTRPFPSPPWASWDLPTPNYLLRKRRFLALRSRARSLTGPWSCTPGLLPHVLWRSYPSPWATFRLPSKGTISSELQDALYLSQSQFFRVTLILYNPTLTKPSSFPFLLAKYVCSSSLAGPLTVLHTPCLFLAQGLSHTLSHPQTLSSLNSPTRSYPVCPASWCSLSPA